MRKNKKYRRLETGYEWDDYYALLYEFNKEHGHIAVMSTYVSKDGVKLGLWLSNQRYAFKNGTIWEDQIIRLRQLDMYFFSDNYMIISWNRRYHKLKEYYEEHGNSIIDYKDESLKSLYIWTVNQKHAYVLGNLEDWQIEKFNQIDFKFKMVRNKSWVNKIRGIRKKNIANIPLSKKDLDWIQVCIQTLKEHPNRIKINNRIMFENLIKELEPQEMSNEKKYDCIMIHLIKNKLDDIPKDFTVNNVNLDDWYFSKKKSLKLGDITNKDKISIELIEKKMKKNKNKSYQ